MTKTFQAIIAAALVAASAAPALAQISTVPQTMTVVTADLDLSTQSGRDQLDHRIDRAARQVCGFNSDSRDLGDRIRTKACLANAKLVAMRQVEGRSEVAVALPKR